MQRHVAQPGRLLLTASLMSVAAIAPLVGTAGVNAAWSTRALAFEAAEQRSAGLVRTIGEAARAAERIARHFTAAPAPLAGDVPRTHDWLPPRTAVATTPAWAPRPCEQLSRAFHINLPPPVNC